jgi:hypothetical protein
MAASGIIRRRALLLLVAFFLSLAGQAVAGAAMARQGSPTTLVSVTTGKMCGDCAGGGDTPMMPQCPVAFCTTMPAMPTQTASFGERIAPEDFVAARYEIPIGVASAPDPHPPRS